MEDNKLVLAFSQMAEAIRGLGGIMRAATPGKMKSGKTRRGAKHKVGRVFLGRKMFNGTPAEYRRQHRGALKTAANDGTVTKFVPNYKQPHAAPKGRNVWTSK